MQLQEKIQENKKFRIAINGELYECYIRIVIDFYSSYYNKYFYLNIKKIKPIELSWFKRLFRFSNEVIEWKDDYFIGNSITDEKIKYHIIDGTHWFEIDDVKKWVNRAVVNYENNMAIINKEKELAKTIKHKDIL